ncbi:MAG: T9SS type A sorting domain-containing protein [Prevotella sp.]|nr:T9SS type A sorting domain-containing protein [Prevotella sp.]
MNYLILLVLFLSASTCCAQTELQYARNKFRANDKLIKHQIAYKGLGRNGKHVLWDCGEIETINKNYELNFETIEACGDSCIVGTEHSTMYYYHTTDTAIALTGFENNTTKVSYDKPEKIITFPMVYGDSVSGYFHGTGSYCDKVALRNFGCYKTKADAFGVLISPDGDTIRNVLRIHTEQNIYEEHLHIDSMGSMSQSPYTDMQIKEHMDTTHAVMRNDIYKWYAPGYRYPILETLKTFTYENGIENSLTTAFYYPPSEQRYLEYDNENRKIQEQLLLSGGDTRNPVSGNIGFTYNVYISNNDKISLEYQLLSDAGISYYIYTPDGKTIFNSGVKNQSPGIYKEYFNLTGYSKGIYLIDIHVNDSKYTGKILLK